MRFQGVLSAWNPEAGHGRIRPTGGGAEVFVGLAAFPTDGEGPRLDEPLSFEVVTSGDGRKQAVNLKRLPAARAIPALREATGIGRARVRQSQRKRRLGLAAGGAALALLLVVGGMRWWPPGGKTAEVPVAMRR